MDAKTSIADLKNRVKKFCEDRDWDQYHGPKDLAIGVIPRGCLSLEHFRFLSESQERQYFLIPNNGRRSKMNLQTFCFLS